MTGTKTVTVKLDADVVAMVRTASYVLSMRYQRRVTLSGALDVIVRDWCELGDINPAARAAILAAAAPAGTSDPDHA
jgi:hypothetical protein